MCGIAGFVDLKPERGESALAEIGRNMGDRIAHRGPDDAGVWTDPSAGVCLSFRRLSIIDLSAAGHQPMVSSDGRYVLVFNGEIYNHADLRRDLEARFGAMAWRGHSDTEVLLEAIARLGLEPALRQASGMFALALWDRAERRFSLARDRVGEKPLYYGRMGSTFLFGSELKALQAHPSWRGELDRSVIPSYLRFGYVPTPWSIYRGIRKLEPGHLLTAALDELSDAGSRPYWRFPLPAPEAGEGPGALDALEAALGRAVGRQMEADVPLGCFLSGGIDSSLVTALAQSRSNKPVQSFSIGFDDPELNEAPFAAAVAKHLGTDHTELYVSGRSAVDIVPDLARIYDEPFADSSQVPTILLSRLARKHVTVAVSGDAGDELFAGYDRYDFLKRTSWLFRYVPAAARRVGAATLSNVPAAALQAALSAVFPKGAAQLNATRLERIVSFLRHPSGYAAYKDLMSHFASPETLAPQIGELSTGLDEVQYQRDINGLLPWAAFIDAVTYLPDDILVKVDRASMSASLEVRVPMLDPEVIDCAARMHWALKTKGGSAKWPLRAILERHVPRSLFERPKRGFGVPLAQWLRADLRDWAEGLLRDGVGLIPNVLAPTAVDRIWREHLAGQHDHKARLWILLMLQQWAVENGVTG